MNALTLLSLTLRVAVGLMLTVAGLLKLRAGFIWLQQTIEGYQLMGTTLNRIASGAVPIVEVGLGIMLIFNIFAAAATVASIALLLVFTAAISLSARLGNRPNCGCFGKSASSYPFVVKRNLVLIAALLLTLTGQPLMQALHQPF